MRVKLSWSPRGQIGKINRLCLMMLSKIFLLSTIGSLAGNEQKDLPWAQERLALLLCPVCQAGQGDPAQEERETVSKHMGRDTPAIQQTTRENKHYSTREMVSKEVTPWVVRVQCCPPIPSSSCCQNPLRTQM